MLWWAMDEEMSLSRPTKIWELTHLPPEKQDVGSLDLYCQNSFWMADWTIKGVIGCWRVYTNLPCWLFKLFGSLFVLCVGSISWSSEAMDFISVGY